MNKIDLNLYTTTAKEGDQYKIADIPPKLWAQFVKRAQEVLPERGEDAWSAFLCDAITSVVDGDSHTFIMTDIPIDAKQALDEACQAAHCRADQVIGQIYRSAQLGKVHILNITDREQTDETHTMVVVGLPDKSWQGWDTIGKQANVETGYLLGMLLEMAGNDSLRFSPVNPAMRPPNIPGHPNAEPNTRNSQAQGMERERTGASNNTGNGTDGGGRTTGFTQTPRSSAGVNTVPSNRNRSGGLT